MDELKRGLVCVDCVSEGLTGVWPSECLDFDHRNPDEKLGSIRSFIHHPEKLTAELAKCDVVCANHHRIRTRRRGVSEKTRAAIRVARNAPGSKERDSEIQRKLWKLNHNTRAEAVREAQRRPEVREKNRKSVAASWQDPTIRAKRQEAMKLAWARRKEKLNKSSS